MRTPVIFDENLERWSQGDELAETKLVRVWCRAFVIVIGGLGLAFMVVVSIVVAVTP